MAVNSADVAGIVLGVLIYLTVNITGTIYYTKLDQKQPPTVSDSLMSWNLASVILGWLLLPPLNLSSSICYGMYADDYVETK